MRMLIDPGNYSAIGGDSYLSGLVSGFEVVPYPLLTEVKGLPEAVGDSYKGKTLFTQDENGTYKANYEESIEYLEYYFPKDKYIFLCYIIYQSQKYHTPCSLSASTLPFAGKINFIFTSFICNCYGRV